MSNNFHRNHIKENDMIKEIISKYYDILNDKNIINEELNLVKLNSTNYSNLKFDKDGTQNDSVNKPLLDDINAAAKSVGVVATITTAKTGHNRLTKGSKNVSRHMNGTGVDIAILDGVGSGKASNATNGLPKFRELGFKLKNALVSMGYIWNTERGNDKAVLWHTDTGGNHYNHIHVSNRTGLSSSPPTNDFKSEDPKDEDPKDEDPKDEAPKEKKTEKSGLDALGGFLSFLRGDKPKIDSPDILDGDKETDDDKESETDDDKESETDDDKSSSIVIVDIKDYKITEPSTEDKNFYSKILEKLGAKTSKQNLLFFYAWRQAEGAKSKYNPFNTTHKKEGSTFWNCLKRKGDTCLGGVRNYKTKEDGIDATVSTIKNGHYPCILEGLKSDKGAMEIANCSSNLKTWGTSDGILRVLKTKKIKPNEISKSEVKVVNEGLYEETKRISELIKKVL